MGGVPQRQQPCARRQCVAAAANENDGGGSGGAPSSGSGDHSSDGDSPQLPGKRYSATLRKPVGVVFSQKDGGPVFIESVTPGSNADKAGFKAGDVLNQCSAVTLKAGKEGRYEREGYGDRPYDNWETVMIDTEGLKFETVMNALKSNSERWGINTVTLVVRRVE